MCTDISFNRLEFHHSACCVGAHDVNTCLLHGFIHTAALGVVKASLTTCEHQKDSASQTDRPLIFLSLGASGCGFSRSCVEPSRLKLQCYTAEMQSFCMSDLLSVYESEQVINAAPSL